MNTPKYGRKAKKRWRRQLERGDTAHCGRCGACGEHGCCSHYCNVCKPFNLPWLKQSTPEGEVYKNIDKQEKPHEHP
jgi:hypothetical protein